VKDGLVERRLSPKGCREAARPKRSEAFREAIINAFYHRDYRDPDEVHNPGTLLEGLTLRKLRTSKVSRRRNPLIADLLRRIHLIEAWGRGIPLILDKTPGATSSTTATTIPSGPGSLSAPTTAPSTTPIICSAVSGCRATPRWIAS